MAETWNKKEREKKKRKNKQAKAERRAERKESVENGESTGNMMAYLDENGNLSDTPPDPKKKIVVVAEDIVLGIPKQGEYDAAEASRTGKITFFNHDKGFGFIEDEQSKESVFVHINALSEAVNENDKVSFEVEMGPKGSNAINVTLIK